MGHELGARKLLVYYSTTISTENGSFLGREVMFLSLVNNSVRFMTFQNTLLNVVFMFTRL